MKKYVLGVDGGNTKTQYYLYAADGEYVDGLRTGTCSHEQMSDGFVGCKKVIEVQINQFLSRNKIKPSDLSYSVFGLAGADFEWQKKELSKIIQSLGFANFVVDNDGYIGLKAGSPDGTGVCSINGTGTVTVGINRVGKRLQVGGIGDVSGDRGGGEYLARRTAEAVYNNCFRCGEQTILRDMIFDAFGIKSKEDYPEAILKILSSAENILKINIMLAGAEKSGDKAAIKVLNNVGTELGFSTAGCLRELGLDDVANIVLAGSVWVKGDYIAMLDAFKQAISQSTTTTTKYTILKQEPAMGAVVWALESVGILDSNTRAKLLK